MIKPSEAEKADFKGKSADLFDFHQKKCISLEKKQMKRVFLKQ